MEIQKISSLEEKFPTAKEVAKEFKTQSKHTMNKEQLKLLENVLDFRKKTLEDDNWGGAIFNDSGILGTYLVATNGGKKIEDYTVIGISNRPNVVLGRTTGRPGYSCEQIKETYWKGPFQDTAYRNPTVYFHSFDLITKGGKEFWKKLGYTYENKKWTWKENLDISSIRDALKKQDNLKGFKWAARLNTRWCITGEGKLDVGIDPNIYPMAGKDPALYTNYMVAIWQIFAQYGFLNYRVAETPYVYVGHSDSTMGGGTFYLPFIGLKYRLGTASERMAYDVMKAMGIRSKNEKETMIIAPDNYVETVDEEEEDIVDKILIQQRLTQIEIETLREILIVNYKYSEREVTDLNDDEIIEEFQKIYRL